MMNRDVHVWRAYLDVPHHARPSLAAVLSEEERIRAARIRARLDRDRWIAARATLRVLLASYLSRQPEEIVFAVSRLGKPSLASALGSGTLHFNLAHCDGVGVYAVARGLVVGVDIERLRPDAFLERVVPRYVPSLEVARIRALPPRLRQPALIRAWVRHEAQRKATGGGLSGGPDPSNGAAQKSCVYELPLAAGYAAALAVLGHCARIACWNWSSARGAPSVDYLEHSYVSEGLCDCLDKAMSQ